MLGHHHIADHVEATPHAHSFQRPDKRMAGLLSVQQRSAMITAEGDEMQLSGLLVPLQTPRHKAR
jgi:hypothetical protein